MEKYGATENELYEVFTRDGLFKVVKGEHLTFDEAMKLVEQNPTYQIKPQPFGE